MPLSIARPGRALLSACALIAAAPADASALEDEVLARINAVRADPAGYARELERYGRGFEGRIVRIPGDPVEHVTQEGWAAVDDAVDFLRRQRPLPPLESSELLARAARRWAAEQGAAGTVGHYGADRSTPGARVMREGGGGFVAEIIGYGEEGAEAVVRQFVVDDGVPSRGHRLLVFAPAYRFAGVGCAPHRDWGQECVVDLGQKADGSAGPRLLPQN